MSQWGEDAGFGGNPSGDSQDDDYPNAADPDASFDEQPIHEVTSGAHSHAHRAFGIEGADAVDFHVHEHEHADGNSHLHHDSAPVSSSGRQPSGELRRRSRDWGEPTDLSSRLSLYAEQTAQIQRDMYRCHEALMDNEAQLETPAVLAEHVELERIWSRLARQEAEAHSRLRTAQRAWAHLESESRQSVGETGGVQMDDWEKQWRRDRNELGLSPVDRDRS